MPLLEALGDPVAIVDFLAGAEPPPSGVALREALLLLVEVFGPNGAREVARRDPSLLAGNAAAMRATPAARPLQMLLRKVCCGNNGFCQSYYLSRVTVSFLKKETQSNTDLLVA